MQTNGILHFKPCTIEQINLLHQLAVQSYKESYTEIWHDQGKAYLERFYKKSRLASELTDSSCAFFLIYQSETAVGFFKLRENALPPFDLTACLELNKIYILREFTGKNIGYKTLNFVMDLAHAKGRSILWLNVMEASKARKFYERNGFDLQKQITLDYPYMKEGLNVLSTYKIDLQNYK
jgi:GNAT superfamily N-acetyltransferase